MKQLPGAKVRLTDTCYIDRFDGYPICLPCGATGVAEFIDGRCAKVRFHLAPHILVRVPIEVLTRPNNIRRKLRHY